jgi:hypothetical protein
MMPVWITIELSRARFPSSLGAIPQEYRQRQLPSQQYSVAMGIMGKNDSRIAVVVNLAWLKGTSPPSPTGRPLSARSRISEKLLADLADGWEEHGVGVLQRLAVTDPGKLAQIAYGLLPRDVFISVEQRAPGNLDAEEWQILRRVIDLIKVSANGAELGRCWRR